MLIEIWPIGRPKPYPKNARKWTAVAVEKVAASIREYRVAAADRLRRRLTSSSSATSDWLRRSHWALPKCRSMSPADLTPAQVKGLRIMDNRSHEEAEWDIEPAGAGDRGLASPRL